MAAKIEKIVEKVVAQVLESHMAAARHELVQKVLEETRGNRKKAAQRLNISYKALLNKLKRWTADGSRPIPSQSNLAARL